MRGVHARAKGLRSKDLSYMWFCSNLPAARKFAQAGVPVPRTRKDAAWKAALPSKNKCARLAGAPR